MIICIPARAVALRNHAIVRRGDPIASQLRHRLGVIHAKGILTRREATRLTDGPFVNVVAAANDAVVANGLELLGINRR